MRVTIIGLSITSSWGNGHATNYRALARALTNQGDEVTFLERDQPWYAQHRDLRRPSWCATQLYTSITELTTRFAHAILDADLVIIGSFVPEGAQVARWVLEHARGPVGFYDIDTPVTLQKLRAGDTEHLSADLLAEFDLYLSFTGGPILDALRAEFGARRAVAFYCFVDPDAYQPMRVQMRHAINYLGTYSAGRQPAVEELLLEPARRSPERKFLVAGPMYPDEIDWPANVERVEHLAPGEHPRFYCSSEFTLNATRAEMRRVGFCPSVRLFEAAACGAPIISDIWPGIETVLEPGEEILLARSTEDVLAILAETSEERRRAVARAARRRVLAEHTAENRARTLHELMTELREAVPR
jgi:spore maturation protein CgeB